MVEPQGDGVNRPVQYAKWRMDKPADPGYSRELVSVILDPKYYDNLEGQPPMRAGCYTFLDYFENHVRERPNETYLG